MENVVLLKDILKDNQYPEAGVLLFKEYGSILQIMKILL